MDECAYKGSKDTGEDEMTIEQLIKEYEIKRKELNKLDEKIDALKLKSELPKLRKQYEGRYFKYANDDCLNHWFVYSYCEKVIDLREAIIHRFEITPIECKFSIGAEPFFFLQAEIKKSEYESALKKLILKLAKVAEALNDH